jgi:hypothetical protein
MYNMFLFIQIKMDQTMFKIILACISLLIVNVPNILFASETKRECIVCAPELKSCFEAIKKIPEARQLLVLIQKEGPLRIIISHHPLARKFGAFWDVDNRIICVNQSSHRSEGALIGSILFEMFNASISSKLDHLDNLAMKGQIDKESYIQSVERLEWENSISASRIANKGIQEGIFPSSAFLPTYSTFEEHYRIQKMGGHSAWIAHNFDQLNS